MLIEPRAPPSRTSGPLKILRAADLDGATHVRQRNRSAAGTGRRVKAGRSGLPHRDPWQPALDVAAEVIHAQIGVQIARHAEHGPPAEIAHADAPLAQPRDGEGYRTTDVGDLDQHWFGFFTSTQ